MENDFIKAGELKKPTLYLHWSERSNKDKILATIDKMYNVLMQCDYVDGQYNASVYNLIRLYIRNTIFEDNKDIDKSISELAFWVNINWRY